MGTSSWLFSVWLRPPTPPLRPRLTPTFCTEATAVWDTLDTSDTEVSMEATDTSDTLPLPWLEATLPTLLPPPCTSEVLPPLPSPPSLEDMLELDVTSLTPPESSTLPRGRLRPNPRPRLIPTCCTVDSDTLDSDTPDTDTLVWDTPDSDTPVWDTTTVWDTDTTLDTLLPLLLLLPPLLLLPLWLLLATLPSPPPSTSPDLTPPPSPLSPEDMPELDVTVPTLPESCTAPKESAKLSRLVFVEIFEQT